MKYFEQQALPDFYKSITQAKATNDIYTEELDEGLNQAVYEAIEAASREMAAISKENDNGQGSGEDWKPVLEMLESGDPRFRQIFTNTMREAIGANLLARLRDNLRENRKGKKRLSKKLIQDAVKNSLGNIRSQTAQKGGLVAEVIQPMILSYLYGSGSEDFQVQSDRLGSNRTMTDFMSLWTTNMDMDLEKFSDQLKAAMESGSEETMRQVYERMEEYYKNSSEMQQNMKDLYMVFVNSKNYSVGHDATNYTKDYKGDLDELPDFLKSMGISVDNAENFLRFVYNTGDGAIVDWARDQVQDQICNALKAAAAKMMFDDYEQIGQGSTNSIHLYYLSGKYVPASEVFQLAADAISSRYPFSHANVRLPGPIDDRFDPGSAKTGKGWGGSTDMEIKQNIYDHWKKEARNAREVSSWSVQFTLRIKYLLQNIR